MPKVIIPDKICPHCGGNEWFVSYVKKSNGELRVKYSCMTNVRKANKTFNEKNSETIKLKRLKGGQYHNLTLKREKQNRDNLSDGYVRVRVARSLNKSCKCVTSEEIKNKREELIKMREYKKNTL